jgi:hypothetical protein
MSDAMRKRYPRRVKKYFIYGRRNDYARPWPKGQARRLMIRWIRRYMPEAFGRL